MTVDLQALRAKAQAAATGRWLSPERVQADEFYGEYFELEHDGHFGGGGGLFADDSTGEFIAAVDPQTVLALLDAAEAAREFVTETSTGGGWRVKKYRALCAALDALTGNETAA